MSPRPPALRVPSAFPMLLSSSPLFHLPEKAGLPPGSPVHIVGGLPQEYFTTSRICPGDLIISINYSSLASCCVDPSYHLVTGLFLQTAHSQTDMLNKSEV